MRKIGLAGVAVAVLVAGAGVSALVVSGDSGDEQQKQRPAADVGPQVVAALRLLETRPQDVVSSVSRGQVGDPAAAVPRGTKVSADTASWAPNGTGSGTILVTLTAPDGSSLFQAVMIREQGGWKVLGTIPVEDGARP